MISSFFKGWVIALRFPGVLLLKYFASLGLSLFAAIPLYGLLHRYLDHSSVRETWIQSFQTFAILEFQLAEKNALSSLTSYYWLPLLVLFALFSLLLTGGALARYAHAVNGAQPAAFWKSCFKNLPRLLLVLLLCFVLAGGLVFGPLLMWWPALLERLTLDSPGRFNWWLALAGNLFIVVVLGSWVLRVYDYARCLTCAGTNPLVAFVQAVMFSTRHFMSTLGLWLAFFLLPLVLYALVVWVKPMVEGNAGGQSQLLWVLVAGQALVLLRITNGLASLAGQYRFYIKRTDFTGRDTGKSQGTPESGHDSGQQALPPKYEEIASAPVYPDPAKSEG